ncbi:MAG: CvpA family protein [Monoglobales bacterium]
MLLDIIFLAIIIACVVWGAKRGIIKTALGLSSVLVSIIAAIWLYEPFMTLISNNESISKVIFNFKEGVKTAILPQLQIGGVFAGENGGVPALFSAILGSNIIAQGQNAIAAAIADAVVYLTTIVVFIILTKLVVSIVFKVFKVTSKLPLIKHANGLVGGLLGLVVGIFVCWITAAVLTLFIGQQGSEWIVSNVETSRIAKHLFSTNIIFSIFKQ